MIAKIKRFLGIHMIASELGRLANRRRTHFGRLIYLILLCCGFSFFWFMLQYESRGNVSESIVIIFAAVSWGQLLLLCAGSAQMAAGLVAEERDRNTMDVLLSTPISSFSIMFGKYSSIMTRGLLYVFATLPAFALLMAEGGISPIQIAGVALLTMCGVSWFASISLFGSLTLRKLNSGQGLASLLVGFYISGVFFLEIIPEIAKEYPGTILDRYPPLSEATYDMINFVRAFHIAAYESNSLLATSGGGQTFGLILATNTAIAIFVTLFFLVLSSALLRPVARIGKTPLWKVLLSSIRNSNKDPRDLPRRKWESEDPRPWESAPTLWRAAAAAASPNRRRAQVSLVFIATVALVFAPFVFYVGEFVVGYTVYSAGEISDGHGIPPLPEHPLFEGGKMRLENGKTTRTDYYSRTFYRNSSWRNVRESKNMLIGWSCFLGGLLAFALVLAMAFGTAAFASRERERKRLPILLSTPLSDYEISLGFIVEGTSRWLGAFMAAPLIAVIGSATGLFAWKAALAMLFYVIACGTFFSAWGIRFGILSKSLRMAQGKLGTLYIAMGALWPLFALIFGVIAHKLARVDDDIIGYLCSVSPIALPGYIAATFGNERISGRHAEWAITTGAVITLYCILGMIFFSRFTHGIRKYAQKI